MSSARRALHPSLALARCRRCWRRRWCRRPPRSRCREFRPPSSAIVAACPPAIEHFLESAADPEPNRRAIGRRRTAPRRPPCRGSVWLPPGRAAAHRVRGVAAKRAEHRERPSGEIASACRTGREETFELVSCSAGRTLICSRETNGAGWRRSAEEPAARAAEHERSRAAKEASGPAGATPCRVARGAAAGDARSALLSLNRNCATAMSPMRALRSFSRHLWIDATTVAGISAGSALQSGVDFTTAAIVSVTSSPGKARTPVSIS